LGDVVQFLGQALTIDITPQTKEVTIAYHTNPNAAALQWLEPSQTAGGKRPFLFTQSQAILARTWVPCQDGPGVRMTYSARVKTRPDLMAVMSATNPTAKTADGVYEFSMPQPIPSYLLALAVGDLAFKSTGPRSGVYAEPSMVDKAAWELEDTEKMIEAAESLYGPYRWDRYDVIVLPPSFPFGGMENPRLTFATPTILAGDRSLVALVAHELAHSWSGNLVTNATWNDFWLNEGFTVYFEHRIMEQVYGRTYSEMLAQLSMQDLQATINELGATHPDTHLKLNLGGRDPDEGMTDIAYNKGYFFLRLIEEAVGREKWDAFLKSYFDAFAFGTMTTEGFISYLRENLIHGDKNLEEKIQIDRWVSGPGLPEGAPEVRSGEFGRVEEQLNAWKNGALAGKLATKDWTTHHWLHFLRNLPTTLSSEQMADLDKAFAFSRSGNSEILAAWFPHVITHSYQPGYTALENFLMGVGRRKFLKPLYTKLA
ncbi:MAG: M1 family metallopeptidase, partial [Bacteroidota bacterium]